MVLYRLLDRVAAEDGACVRIQQTMSDDEVHRAETRFKSRGTSPASVLVVRAKAVEASGPAAEAAQAADVVICFFGASEVRASLHKARRVEFWEAYHVANSSRLRSEYAGYGSTEAHDANTAWSSSIWPVQLAHTDHWQAQREHAGVGWSNSGCSTNEEDRWSANTEAWQEARPDEPSDEVLD